MYQHVWIILEGFEENMEKKDINICSQANLSHATPSLTCSFFIHTHTYLLYMPAHTQTLTIICKLTSFPVNTNDLKVVSLSLSFMSYGMAKNLGYSGKEIKSKTSWSRFYIPIHQSHIHQHVSLFLPFLPFIHPNIAIMYLAKTRDDERELSFTQQSPQWQALIAADHELIQEAGRVVLLRAGFRPLSLHEWQLGGVTNCRRCLGLSSMVTTGITHWWVCYTRGWYL